MNQSDNTHWPLAQLSTYPSVTQTEAVEEELLIVFLKSSKYRSLCVFSFVL